MIALINIAPLVVSDGAATFDRVEVDERFREAVWVHAGALCDSHGVFATVIGSSSLPVQPVEI